MNKHIPILDLNNIGNVKRDENYIPLMLALLNTDGSTPTPLKATPSTNILDNDDGSTGSDNGGDHAIRDDNRIPGMIAVSEVDGITPVALYGNSSGKLLTDST